MDKGSNRIKVSLTREEVSKLADSLREAYSPDVKSISFKFENGGSKYIFDIEIVPNDDNFKYYEYNRRAGMSYD